MNTVNTKQVDKKAYEFEHYSYESRWVSYYHQLREVFRRTPKSVLEIGLGDGVLGSFLRQNSDIEYKSMDIADDLHPDIVGSVLSIPVADKSFDMVVAFEVLEHIPFDDFSKALGEMRRVSRKYVLLSLSHPGPVTKLNFKVPFVPEVKVAVKIPFAQKHVFNGEHYWEIGKRGFSASRIRSALKEYFSIEDEFVPYGNQYHRFFVLKIK